LRGQIGPAELRDRAALGQALVEGKAEPASEAAKLKAELEQEERNAEALALAVQSAHGQVAELVAANRREWRKETLRELSRAVARYRDAITEVEDAREALSSEATLVTWLDGGAGLDAATDQLGAESAPMPAAVLRCLSLGCSKSFALTLNAWPDIPPVTMIPQQSHA
jgi:hypothetical protein